MNLLRVLVVLPLASLCHALSSDGPILDNLKGSEVKYARLFWDYNVTEGLIPGHQDSDSGEGGAAGTGYKFMIPLPERLAGLTYIGHAARLRLLLERARNGERLRVGALGGSITAGHGVGGQDYSYARYFMDWLNLAFPPDKSTRPSIMNDTSKHDFLNGAVPGTVSDYTSSCLFNHLIPEADLVFVEFAINDSPISTWTLDGAIARRPFERLLRKLLRLPSKPAVVLVNMYAVAPASNTYHHTAERDFGELAPYYSLPSVSLKAAVLPSGLVKGAEEVSPGAIFNGGAMHPGRGGHVVVTEMLITLFLEMLRRNSLIGTSPEELSISELKSVAARPLPPPVCEGNYESSIDTCYIEDQLQRLVQQPVVGWNWTDEGRGKWGFVSLKKGDELQLKINTRLEGKRSATDSSALILLQVAYLKSYRGMGTAQVSCTSGCSCEPLIIDAFDRRPVSVTSMADIQVSQSSKCILAITSMGPSSAAAGKSSKTVTNGYKFKLMGVVVGEEPGATSGNFDHVRMVLICHPGQRQLLAASALRCAVRGAVLCCVCQWWLRRLPPSSMLSICVEDLDNLGPLDPSREVHWF
ncbi:hypothetical protein VOLCADRAFT_89682 [Volvox carteri f. nagariensis]|uniref:SGNH hydrolase-type esterase domain-containing protein n=1 Tax=Volvox carteri f. nagariensis TaxID=3068 RepID=D8TRT3_VOLCA|nr:uncharacterized protein VOLCADRAFT_89682 [Volvox carteri f. nagariensis]EFJ49699.1 hypothetical protein VOLCADRAFT_89682 [Volvox carteri f. nagariensis]|eukprot:XP_002949206.1 hypothetical protein VOLCADRAFT_89682 [Volvox carteri f. nagariensis]